MENETALIKQLYEDFNARKTDSVMAMLTENVAWANGMDGGYVHGQKDLKAYWERQWAMRNPQIKPVSFRKAEDGSIVVDVLFSGHCHPQEFKDMPAKHIFHFKDGLVTRFDIHGRA